MPRMIQNIANKFQNAANTLWPVALVVMLVVVPFEVRKAWKRKR